MLLLTAMTGSAQATQAPAAMHAYDFVVGRWECKGVTPAGKVDCTFTQVVDKPSGSEWFRFRDASAKGSNISFLTYESNGHLWRYISIFDSGGYSIGTAPDFAANKQTWTGSTYRNGTRKSWGRIDFIKVSDREKREDFFEVNKSGQNRFTGSEVCTKRVTAESAGDTYTI